ncbi:hypothetical protein [Magnetofaba australis]|uniref:hypothetical protein n=1 Tax=Magnetofaba australis TaxID=1472297 RepID=UPI000A19D7D5|nr:hypothetical protein [Magnetofaba australis]
MRSRTLSLPEELADALERLEDADNFIIWALQSGLERERAALSGEAAKARFKPREDMPAMWGRDKDDE